MSQTLPVVVDYDSLFSKVAEVVRSNAKGAIKALLFGSLARREANKDSDVDLLLVWPADGDADYQWEASMETAYRVDRIADMHCLPLVYTEDDYRRMPQRYPHLAESLSRDGIDLLTY